MTLTPEAKEVLDTILSMLMERRVWWIEGLRAVESRDPGQAAVSAALQVKVMELEGVILDICEVYDDSLDYDQKRKAESIRLALEASAAGIMQTHDPRD